MEKLLINTRGIVLHKVKYSESSLIVKIFTEELGLQSYIVKGISSKKGKFKLSYFQPMTLLDLVVYNKPNKSLQTIKELKISHPYQSLSTFIEKQTVLIFLNEILYKIIRHENVDKSLFQWVYQVIIWFDLQKEKSLNFHLFFLLQLTKFLGFYPKIPFANKSNQIFDLQGGVFLSSPPFHPYYIDKTETLYFLELININLTNIIDYRITPIQRKKLLDILITYYQLHIPDLGKIKSLEILRIISSSS